MKKFKLLRNRAPGKLWLYPYLFLFVIVLILGGCAGSLPPTISLTAVQQENASALLQQLQDISCPNFLDADVTVRWQGYGQSRILNATLQATAKGGLRVGLLDPLFRPVMILASDGILFTLVDNQQGRGYEGGVDSSFFRKYIPGGIKLSTCFTLLAGRLPEKTGSLVRFSRSEKDNTYWFVFTLQDGIQQHAELDPGTGLILRQLLVNRDDSILFDVRYDWDLSVDSDCFSPEQIFVSGKNITGSVELTLDTLYTAPLADEIFHLQIPDHFTVLDVE